jgi:hypothetical protein
MFPRTLRTVSLAGSLAAIVATIAISAASAATDIHLIGHFTQHFGGRNGDGVTCEGDAINCGSGRVEGYGQATDAFYYSDEEGFRHTLTLADGSSITVQLEFADIGSPGAAGDAPGAAVSFGNPVDIVFDATVIGASGQFAGATGGGTFLLEQAGNVDQITADLGLRLS